MSATGEGVPGNSDKSHARNTSVVRAKALARGGAQSPGPLLSGEDIDEAVWAAYPLNDKTPSRKTCCFDATLLNRAVIGGVYKV